MSVMMRNKAKKRMPQKETWVRDILTTTWMMTNKWMALICLRDSFLVGKVSEDQGLSLILYNSLLTLMLACNTKIWVACITLCTNNTLSKCRWEPSQSASPCSQNYKNKVLTQNLLLPKRLNSRKRPNRPQRNWVVPSIKLLQRRPNLRMMKMLILFTINRSLKVKTKTKNKLQLLQKPPLKKKRLLVLSQQAGMMASRL